MNTKEKILLKGLELFSEYGYESIGVARIVDEVGVKKPTLYHYFGSKEGLLKEIINRNFDPFLIELEKIRYNGDIVKNLEDIAKLFFDFAMENPSFYKFILSNLFVPLKSDIYDLIYDKLKKQNNLIQQIFIYAEKDHGNMKGRSEKFGISFLGTINSYIIYYFLSGNNMDENICFLVCKQFMHGIFS